MSSEERYCDNIDVHRPHSWLPVGSARTVRCPGHVIGLYLVGESGPELFVPTTPGQVIPNERN